LQANHGQGLIFLFRRMVGWGLVYCVRSGVYIDCYQPICLLVSFAIVGQP